jgi:hypothetical protein
MIYALFVALVVFSVCSQIFLWTFAIMQILDGNWINAGNILMISLILQTFTEHMSSQI